MRIASVLALGLVCSTLTGALAQQPVLAPEEPEIVVTGVEPEQVRAFVEQVSVVPAAADQIGRWDDDICLRVAGLGEEQGQSIVDRVSMRAQAIDLRAGGVNCNPNVFVFFAADSDSFARQLVDQRKSLFAYYHEEHIITLGQAALTDFAETSRPVRWWHVTQTRGSDGARLGSDQAGNSAPPPPSQMQHASDGFTGLQAVRSNGTRTRAPERQDFNRAIVIVDGARASGYPLDSLADYIAMVTLAQIDPTARTRGYPTILNLFDEDPDRISFEMTNWDVSYLDGLYRTTRNAASPTQQMREISRRMQGDARPDG